MRGQPTLITIVIGLALASCSDDGGSQDPAVAGPSQATDGSASDASAASVTATSTTAPSTTAAPSSAPTTTFPPTTPAPGTAAGEYQPTAAPTFPASAALPTGDGLPDGPYYAVVDGVAADAAPRLRLTIYELLTGPEAIAAAQADGVGLDSDLYVRPQPAVAREIVLGPEIALSVARPDRPGVSYTVSAAELVRLVSTGAPSTGAPDGYRYLPFPYLITVAGGAPTRLEQLWSP